MPEYIWQLAASGCYGERPCIHSENCTSLSSESSLPAVCPISQLALSLMMVPRTLQASMQATLPHGELRCQ